jgi:hypothetical protein
MNRARALRPICLVCGMLLQGLSERVAAATGRCDSCGGQVVEWTPAGTGSTAGEAPLGPVSLAAFGLVLFWIGACSLLIWNLIPSEAALPVFGFLYIGVLGLSSLGVLRASGSVPDAQAPVDRGRGAGLERRTVGLRDVVRLSRPPSDVLT